MASSNSSSGRSHGGIRSGCFGQPVPFWSGNIAGRGGTGLVVIGGVVVEMDDEFVFTMDTLADRNVFLIEVYDDYYLRPW